MLAAGLALAACVAAAALLVLHRRRRPPPDDQCDHEPEALAADDGVDDRLPVIESMPYDYERENVLAP